MRFDKVRVLSDDDLKRQIRLSKLHLEWLEREAWVRNINLKKEAA